MKHHVLLIALASFTTAGVAYGHAHVQKSVPANNSTISQLPKNVVIEFNEAAQLTVLTLQKGDGKAQDLKPLPSAAAKSISVPMPTVDAGSYIINWRAAGDDGHVISGKVLFNVTSDKTPATHTEMPMKH
ncbi:MAG: copper resistance protein CopC [Steroidobacteraceae bacterium]